jgi:PAS domain S-box-containing protein
MTAFTSWSARHRPDEPPSRDNAPAARHPWRIRTSLAVLVVACVLPGLLLSTYFIVSDYEAHKARAVRDVIATARATAASLDRDLASIESGLRVLGSSAALAEDDLAAFHAQARGALPFQNINNIVLIDPQGRQQVNTLRAWGTPLPQVGGPAALMRIFTTAQPVLTDVFTGPVTGKPIMALGIPVQREGTTVYILNAGIFPERLAGVLTGQRLPRDWIAAVLDSQGNIVARTHEMALYVGKPAVPDLVRAASQQAEGVIETDTLEGIPVVTAFTRSNLSGWSVAVGLPRSELTAGLKESLVLLLGVSTALFTLALWVAWRLAVSRVVAPTDRLLARMARISRGESPGPPTEPARHDASLEFVALEQGFTDMSQRLAEREREREALLQRITHTLESIHDGFFQLDDEGRFAYVNRRAETLLRQARATLLGHTPSKVLALQDADALRAVFDSAVNRQQPMHAEVHLPTLRLWLDVHAYPSGRSLGVYMQDVGEQHAARQARQAQQVAEASNQAKTEFLSRMSHELRTPLNAVLGFAQVLKLDTRQPLSPSQLSMLEQIDSSGRHLLTMITDVLDVSRIEAGTMHILIEDVNVSDLLLDCQQTLLGEARAMRIRLALDLPPGPPLIVHADRTRLKQVLLNLLSNAIKYNRAEGEVTLSASQEADAQGAPIRFKVRDTGIGMSPGQLAHLFEPFNRLGQETTGTPGTGIGLVICQRLVALMGGTLRVSSTEQHGSTFFFDLPAAHPPHPGAPQTPGTPTETESMPHPAPPLAEAPYDTRKVLYVEDNLANRDIMAAMLGLRPQIEVHNEMTVHAGMERLDTESFDLVLLDMHLPDGSGLDLLAWMKRHDEMREVPVVVVSADVTPATMAQARAAGALAYLQKPLDLPTVLEVVDAILAKGSVPAKALP